jgi:lipopolysaccharide heptosyltransferase I
VVAAQERVLTLSPDLLRSRQFSKILLIKLSAVGDVVHTIPVLNKLRRRFPKAQLDWLVTPAIGELLRHHPAITRVIEFTREVRGAPLGVGGVSNLAQYAGLAARLRAAQYDLVVDMHGQFRTAVLALASGAPVRIGFDRPRGRVWKESARQFPAQTRKHAWQGAREGSWLAYTHTIPVPTLEKHAVDRYLGVGPLLGLDERPADFSFPIPQQARERVAGLLADHRIDRARLIVMAPGTVWETKQWRREGFAEVAHHFLQRDFAVALIGSARERAVCAEVAALAPGVVNLGGATTLSEVAALIRRATICLTNDSGPMHLAVALDRPVVSVFGSTDPIWIGPYRREGAVLRAPLPCAPCYLRELRDCTHDHACMKAVSAAAVIARMEHMLANAASDTAVEAPTGAQ